MSPSPRRAPPDGLRIPGLRVRRLIACIPLAAVALMGTLTAPPLARAQDLTPDDISLELVSQSISYRAEDDLGIRLRITNDSLAELPGFIVNVGRGSRLTSRSALENSFAERVGLSLLATNKTVAKPLGPGQSRVVKIDEPVEALLQSPFDEEGIYPATISLLDLGGATLIDSLTTHLMFYPEDPESRLNFVVAVPLNELPARGPDNVFDFGVTGSRPTLEESLSERGWLRKTLDELSRLAGGRLRIGLAPTPRLVEEIADMSDGYRRGDEQVGEDDPEAERAAAFIDDLSELLNTDGVQPLLVPYANPDLPSLAASGLDDHVGTQVAIGQAALDDALDVEIEPDWIFPPAGRLNSNSLALLRLSSNAGERTFFTQSSLEQPASPLLSGCPIEELSFTCPVSAETAGGETIGYQADPGLQQRLGNLAGTNEARLDLQRFFAETAMIRQEQPGRSDRILQATLPSMWNPGPKLLRTLYRGLARAPWLKTVTPQEGLDLDIEPVPRRVIDEPARVTNELEDIDYGAIEAALDMVESFDSIGPPPALVQRLLGNILVSESRSWWMNDELLLRGEEYGQASLEEARAEMDKVSIEVNERITLTSRAEDIPVRVLNNAGYPVKVLLELNSTRLTFQDGGVRTFDDGRTPLSVPVRADSSGIFPVTMSLVTPDGSETIAESRPSVRSTEFNNIAVVITVGALLFLVAFYVARWYRRRTVQATQDPA
jgi:hypothetical protein